MNITKIIEYFGLAVALTFIGLGIFVISSNVFNNLPANYKIIFSSLLIAYGGFRLVAIILKIKSRKEYENDEE